MVAAEKRFKIKFATAEISRLKEPGQNVGTLLALIGKKAAGFIESLSRRVQCRRDRVHRGRAGGSLVFLLAADSPVPPGDLVLRQSFCRLVAAAQPYFAARFADLSGSGYAMALLLRRRPSTWLLSGYLTLLVAAFLVLKRYPVLDWVLPPALLGSPLVILGIPIRDGVLEHVVRITGLSYMLFRQIHFLVDAAQGQIERPSFWSYLNYQVNLFTILAGPIQRYQDFDEQWRSLEPALADPQELLQNCMRLLLGVLKIGLVAPFVYKGWDEVLVAVVNHRVAGWRFIVEFLVVFYFYPLYLYFNFAGYCDIVIAAGRFFGMKLPENFNRPIWPVT